MPVGSTQVWQDSVARTSIPDLCFDSLAVGLNRTSCKFYSNSGLGFQVELVASEAREQVTLTHTAVTDKHHCKSRVRIAHDALTVQQLTCIPL